MHLNGQGSTSTALQVDVKRKRVIVMAFTRAGLGWIAAAAIDDWHHRGRYRLKSRLQRQRRRLTDKSGAGTAFGG